ncbi:MAG TPA: hypothetical protein DD670_03865, partial [Planctomycetaceae bacterium]|nr:hypothetical protein [Planctomycetaceae bacterium]
MMMCPMDSDFQNSEADPDPALFDEQLVAYLDGELDGDTARRIETLASDDLRLRDRLDRLGRAWDMLPQLDRAETEGTFTESTLELVAVAAEQDVRRHEGELPRLRRRRQAVMAGSLVLAACLGFAAVAALRPDPNRVLLDDLPVIENVDDYLRVLGNDGSAEENVAFLKKLHAAELFEEDNAE